MCGAASLYFANCGHGIGKKTQLKRANDVFNLAVEVNVLTK